MEILFTQINHISRIVQTATLQAGKGSQEIQEEDQEEEEELLSDEESVRIYPIKATKRKPETTKLQEEQEFQPPKPKRSKPDFCFKTRDY